VIDMVVAEPDLAAEYNRIERLRDPSHTKALSEEDLAALLGAAGAQVVHQTARDPEIGVEPWLEQAGTPRATAEQIRAELRTELEGGPKTGMRPLEKDSSLHFAQRWAILVARK
jgi:hypothetical protein